MSDERGVVLDLLEALVERFGRAEVEAMLADVAPRQRRRQRARRQPRSAADMAASAREQARRAAGE